MSKTKAPECLRQARREMIMALESTDPVEEHVHEQAAHDYMVEAVRDIRRSPDDAHNWDEMNEPQAA